MALAVESIHLGKIMRYRRSRDALKDEIVSQRYVQGQQKEEKSEDPPF